MIISAGLLELLRLRLDPSHEVNWGRFKTLLNSVRRGLEYEQGRQIMNDLLQEQEKLEHLLLTRSESRSLRLIIQQHLVTPLTIYYRGVAQLWLGEHARARANFEKYLALLPEADSESRAHAMLILSGKKLASSDR